MKYRLAAVGLIALAILASGCGRASSDFAAERSIEVAAAPVAAAQVAATSEDRAPSAPATATPATSTPATPEAAKPPDSTPDIPEQPQAQRSPLADKIVSLSTEATEIPDPRIVLVPTALRIPSLGIDAEIVPVGVEPNGDYEVPPAHQVGWYRYGTTPGEPGSAVLAAHIAYNGSDGVFRHLDDLAVGAAVLVEFEDGSTIDLSTSAQAQYDKDELPDDLFDRTGDPRVVLITCGGEFNYSRSSYEDNIVAFAHPVVVS